MIVILYLVARFANNQLARQRHRKIQSPTMQYLQLGRERLYY
jgi:hypothetical protein